MDYRNSPTKAFYSLCILLEKLNIHVPHTTIRQDDEYVEKIMKFLGKNNAMTEKEIDKIDDLIVKNLEAKGHVFTLYGWSYEDCKAVVENYTTTQIKAVNEILKSKSSYYTDAYIQAIKEEMEIRIIEEHLLGIKR
jgi:stalled ribosome rescue protein Dom34